ncbi:uncharacterized protein A4U43_C07F10240 [Asparagus officinalis]|uniref:Uncharacterized protein n=1 Tax=Asparagus officinalis TaxID=4686 RepID=A0A5P1EDV5_ASPOF|nr:uncharacterized protein A4U43_C07F10240 [Asparagus officinalis]
MPQDINEDVEQPNKAVEKIEWPQQVIYWKSIASMNQVLRHDNENKFKDMIAADRVKIKTGTQHEDTGRKITLVDDVPSAGHDTETQTLLEDTKRKIKQSEDVLPPAPDTSTEDENAPIRFSRALNKKKRDANVTRAKVSAATPLKGRVVKPSKWVVTPYTEGKKKKETT